MSQLKYAADKHLPHKQAKRPQEFCKKTLFFAMILQMILPKKKKKEMLRDLFCKTTSLKDSLKGSQLSFLECKLQSLEQLILLSHC